MSVGDGAASWCGSPTTASAARTPRAAPGLRGLADRVEALGGALRVDSPPGAGTRVAAELPIDSSERRDLGRSRRARAAWPPRRRRPRSTSRWRPRPWRSCAATRTTRSPATRPRRSRPSSPPAPARRRRAAWRPGAAPRASRLLLAARASPGRSREWNSPGAGAAFTAGLVLYAAWPPLLAAAALRGPDERPLERPGAGRCSRLADATSLGVLGVASAALSSTRARRAAPSAPPNPLLVAGDAGAWHDLGHAGLALTAAWTAALVALARRRGSRARRRRRRRLAAPVLVPAAARGAVRRRRAARPRARIPLQRPDRPRAVGWARPLALGARRRRRRLGSGCARGARAPRSPAWWSTSASRRRRAACASGSPACSATLRCELLYARDDGAGWIDADGRPRPRPRPDRETTPIVAARPRDRRRRPPPRAARRPGARRRSSPPPRASRSSTSGCTRRAAPTSRELRTSRARIVATADGERRRLERDLHDGAQQRLVTLALGVRLARRHLAPTTPRSTTSSPRRARAARRARRAARACARPLPRGARRRGARRGARGPRRARAAARPRRPPRASASPRRRVGRLLRRRRDAATSRRGTVAVDARVARTSGWSLELRATPSSPAPRLALEDRVGARRRDAHAPTPAALRAELPCAS